MCIEVWLCIYVYYIRLCTSMYMYVRMVVSIFCFFWIGRSRETECVTNHCWYGYDPYEYIHTSETKERTDRLVWIDTGSQNLGNACVVATRKSLCIPLTRCVGKTKSSFNQSERAQYSAARRITGLLKLLCRVFSNNLYCRNWMLGFQNLCSNGNYTLNNRGTADYNSKILIKFPVEQRGTLVKQEKEQSSIKK